MSREEMHGAFRFAPGKTDDLWVHGQDLMREHWEELCVDREHLELNPDWSRYEAMLESGTMFAISVWLEDKLAGYSANIVTQHLHYRGSRWAYNDVLFIGKAHRLGGLGLRLIKATEEEALNRGCAVMAWHAKQGTALEALLPRLGHKVQETIFTRNL